MTVKINELVIKARVEKKPDAVAPSINTKGDEKGVAIKDSVKLLSVNKVNRER